MGGVALTKHTLIACEMPQNYLVYKIKKNLDDKLMSKPHAHLQSMNKTFAKFHKDRNKIVGGVMLSHF